MKRILILGSGGHSRVIIDILGMSSEFEVKGIIDGLTSEKYNLDIPIIGGDEKLQELYNNGINYAAIGLGNLELRKKLYTKLKEIGYLIPNIIHNSAIISKYSSIGEGTCIFANSVINTNSTIGENCIINTGVIVEHDCSIGNNTHLSPGVNIAGGVTIGGNTHVGIGANIIQSINIGNNVTIGAGAAVISDIPDNCVCIGVPAKVIKFKL